MRHCPIAWNTKLLGSIDIGSPNKSSKIGKLRSSQSTIRPLSSSDTKLDTVFRLNGLHHSRSISGDQGCEPNLVQDRSLQQLDNTNRASISNQRLLSEDDLSFFERFYCKLLL